MPPKAKIAAPIDRPLSRAYLRKFTGWSTAHPPGASDPTSLRQMENLLVTREGAVAVRPGLRHLTRQADGVTLWGAAGESLVGSFENFYLNDGSKAYLVAVRVPTNNFKVQFRVFVDDGAGQLQERSLATAGFDLSAVGGIAPIFSASTTYVRYVQIDNKIMALSNNGESAIVFQVGTTKKVLQLAEIPDPLWNGQSRGVIDMPSLNWVLGPQTETPTHAVDFSSTNSIAQAQNSPANVYNYAFCYTYSNEIGETGPSEIAQFKAQRPWGGWSWNTPDTTLLGTQTTTPSQTPTTVAKDTSDRLALIISSNAAASQFDAAIAAGATKLNFYVMSWSDQAPVPVEMHLVGSRDLAPGVTWATHGWFDLNPSTLGLGPTIPIPTLTNRERINTTKPPSAGQGLVAADRLVLVNDPSAAAVVRWTTNESGNYLNFANHRGGGYKTLTSGNMQVPATVKLWQNPQSADTITVLCMGTDGHSTSYYMNPATVTSQSDNTLVMGFEETTATPGTVSPYGCEVANNALYHPLDDQLMKSTASNYNINHKSMTDQIANKWQALKDKDRIVSCFFDQRLYFLVHNPDGEALEAGCNGNELWVLDLASEGGTWSRWLVQGVSLRKLEVLGRLHLGLVRLDGIFAFDESKVGDDTVVGGALVEQPIAWKLETNTQGANRAHDAWSHLQQANLVTGNQLGRLRYGIRGMDRFGQRHEVAKVMESKVATSDDGLPWDMEDYLLIKRDLKEWRFFAEHNGTEPSAGQITLVQYRYAPISVNDGYEYGSIETFEYGAELGLGAAATTTNGVPQPFIDAGTP